MSETKMKIKTYLSKFFKNHEIMDNEDIFSTGFVNSLFAMQLVMFIEKEFNIKVKNKDLDLNNFRTIDSIVSFISKKQHETTIENEVNTK
ncbi:acyl carrier protein [Lysinibacillus sphaericus]|uniref:Acyl carrier protein n=1 Tax=Lysinibacillus sphaericus TaxID=1421 RepID=A0A544UCK1_LYSSH|nr:acyl carrier protein [Lysinibacillus sp. SDF0037]TQR30076.1 acyl carrier protein [Lysinibacillus sp. SDF0037]